MGASQVDVDCEELYKWIDTHTITRQKKNIHRDFADAVPLAEILKQHYPKLVELHNYSPTNGYAGKLQNWQTLNNKVLRKLCLGLTNITMENLARSKPGVIERVLYDIKTNIETRAAGDQRHEDHFYDTSSSDDNLLCKKLTNQKFVPISEHEKLQKELEEREEAITVLKQKVEHYENLLKIKDERIKDLTTQLENVVNEFEGKNEGSPRARFFNRIF